MKLNKLTAAVVAASALVAGNAMALDWDGAPDVVLNMAGATAQDVGLATLMTTLCANDGTADRTAFTNTGTVPGTAYSAYYCTMDIDPTAGVNIKKVLVRKRSAGGSAQGVQPLLTASASLEMNMASCPAPSGAAVYTCAGTEPAVINVGLSDIEPSGFVPPNVPSGGSAPTAAQLAPLTVKQTGALTFGIPVTNALYVAMQTVKGLDTDLDGDGDKEAQDEFQDAAEIATRPANWQDLIEAEMPSMTDDEVSALMKGSMLYWDQFKVGDDLTTAADEGVALTSALGVTPPALDTVGDLTRSRVTICRRVNGSGTQAQMNALFLNVPCAGANADLATADSTACTTPAGATAAPAGCQNTPALPPYVNMKLATANRVIVHEGDGSGNVADCLNQLNDANRWAIGVQSMERKSTKYSYVKINGMSPRLSNVAVNKYMDWASATLQYYPTTATNSNKLDAQQTAVADMIADAMNDGTSLYALAVDHGFGKAGWLGLVGPARPFNPTSPVMQVKRERSICNTPVARDGGSAAGALGKDGWN